MAKQNRETLKNHFKPGSLPTGTNFADLVDSTLNMMDDGFSRSPENGVEISLVGEQYGPLISFFAVSGKTSPHWSINCHSTENSNLGFVSARQAVGVGKPEVLTLTSEGNIGVGVLDPEKLLSVNFEVNGAVKSIGRFGKSGAVAADGQWHDLTPDLHGCHAFEVTAGVGLEGQKKGRYALLHAFAMNTFNPEKHWFNFFLRKKAIRCQHAWYLSRGDRMRLRWVGQSVIKNGSGDHHAYRLQIRSVTDYGEGISIRYSLIQLWFDHFMAQSSQPAAPSATSGS